jgi:Holliday junction DNA helicase RuvA
MIGKLKGTIDSYGEDFVILDVHGVGYLVHCSARTLHALPAAGEAVELAIETHVREDQIRLFGFTTTTEREWFRLLQTVQGVGTKISLAVLSTLKPTDLASAIAMRDKAALTRAPGAGRRRQGRRTHRHRVEGQGASVCRRRSGGRAALGRAR